MFRNATKASFSIDLANTLSDLSKYDTFNDWGGRGCNVFFPVLGGDGTIIAPTGDIFDQPSGQMR